MFLIDKLRLSATGVHWGNLLGLTNETLGCAGISPHLDTFSYKEGNSCPAWMRGLKINVVRRGIGILGIMRNH